MIPRPAVAEDDGGLGVSTRHSCTARFPSPPSHISSLLITGASPWTERPTYRYQLQPGQPSSRHAPFPPIGPVSIHPNGPELCRLLTYLVVITSYLRLIGGVDASPLPSSQKSEKTTSDGRVKDAPSCRRSTAGPTAPTSVHEPLISPSSPVLSLPYLSNLAARLFCSPEYRAPTYSQRAGCHYRYYLLHFGASVSNCPRSACWSSTSPYSMYVHLVGSISSSP
jgi:hypothetical protein